LQDIEEGETNTHKKVPEMVKAKRTIGEQRETDREHAQ